MADNYIIRGTLETVNNGGGVFSGGVIANSGVTSTSFVKSGGTSSQFLKADGSVDSNVYTSSGHTHTEYLNLTGGTLTGKLNSIITDTEINSVNSYRLFSGDISRVSGNTSTVTEGIYQNVTYSGTTDISGLYGINLYTRNLNNSTISNLYGIQSYARNDASGRTTNIVGGYFSVRNNTTGSFNKMLGMQSVLTNNSSDVTNNDMYGMSASLTNGVSGFTDSLAGITSYIYNYNVVNEITGLGLYVPNIGNVNYAVYGVKIGSNEHPWIGSTSNVYGIYIHNSISGGTVNNYAIYSDTVANVYLKGNTGIGILPSTYRLDVSGDTRLNGNLTVNEGTITSPSFVTTGGTSSQFVKGDGTLDSNTYTTTTTLSTSISTEVSTRTSVDESLSSALSTEVVTRGSVDNSLSTELSTEISTRTSVDTSLSLSLSGHTHGDLYLSLSGGTVTGKLINTLNDSGVTNNNTTNTAFTINSLLNVLGTSGINQGLGLTVDYSGTTNISGLYGYNSTIRNRNTGTVSNLYGMQVYSRNEGNGNATNLVGGYFSSRASGTGSFTNMIGLQNLVTNVSTNSSNGTIYGYSSSIVNTGAKSGVIHGIYSLVNNGSTGTGTTINGVSIIMQNLTGIVNVYGLQLGKSSNWSGTPTNSYGLYIDASTNRGSSINYAIYSDSTAKSYLKGDLLVDGNISGKTFVTSGGTSSQFVKGDGTLDSNVYITNTTLSTSMSTEVSTRLSVDNSLSSAISSEVVIRSSVDNSLSTGLSTSMSTEVSTRLSVDNSLSSAISTQSSIRLSVDNSLSIEITGKTSVDNSLSIGLSSEVITRSSVDNSLSSAISTQSSIRLSVDNSLSSAISTSISTEVSTRSSVDNSLSSVISTQSSIRLSVDNSLSIEITGKTSVDNSLSSALSSEIITRSSVDNSLSSAISTQSSTRLSVDNSLSSAISSEVVTRSSVDNSLSSAISTSMSTEVSTLSSVDNSLSSAISSQSSIRLSVDNSLSTSLLTLVPYSGATQDVNLGSHTITVDAIKINSGTTYVVSNPGDISWNSVDGTIDLRLLNNTTLQAGQELHFYGKAQGNISNGDVVQFAGIQGDHFLIKKAVPSEIDLNPEYLMGVATNGISNGNFGYVTAFGKINGIYTTGWSLESPILYFDFVNSGMTNVEPQAPTRRIILASVVKLQTGGSENGIIFVRPSLGMKITDLDDVNGTPLTTTGQIMVWDEIRGVFDFTDNINNYSQTGHTHYQLYQPNGTNPFVYTDNGGNLHIDGNIYQSGSTYETHAEQIYTSGDTIILREGASAGLSTGEFAGLTIKNYDGTNDGSLKIDKDGWMRVGDVGQEQKLATIEENSIDGYIMSYHSGSTQLRGINPTSLPVSTASDLKYVYQDGGKIWSTNKWFIPNSNQTASSSGTTVTITNTVSNFQFLSSMVGAKFGFGTDRRIITSYISATQITVDSIFSQNYSNVVNTEWGVYNIKHSNGAFFSDNGSVSQYSLISNAATVFYQGAWFDSSQSILMNGSGIQFSASDIITWSEVDVPNVQSQIKDLGVKRNTSGVLEVNNGTSGTYRDLKLRSIYLDKIIPNSGSTTGIQIRNSGDTSTIVNVDTVNNIITINGVSNSGNGPLDVSLYDNGIPQTMRIINPNTASADRGTSFGLYGQPGASQMARIDSAWVDSSGLNTYLKFITRNNGGLIEPMRFLYTGDINTLINKYKYTATSPTLDTINDRRQLNSGGTLSFQRNTVSGATKGGGTWVTDMVISPSGNTLIGTTVDTGQKLQVSGTTLLKGTVSGETVFNVQGTTGNLFQINDVQTGTLFSVSDISGINLFSVDSTGYVLQNSGQIIGMGTGTTTVYQIDKTKGSAGWLKYRVSNSTTGAYRAGEVTMVWDNVNNRIEFTEVSSADLFASTSGIVLSATISGNYVNVISTISTGTWNIKLGVRII